VISPYAGARDDVRRRSERDDLTFIEVFANASLPALMRRDPKGHYRRALAGTLEHFTGVSDPYEPPVRADLEVRTDVDTIDESVDAILQSLEERGVLDSARYTASSVNVV
jgi:adenylylsulfate kinase